MRSIIGGQTTAGVREENQGDALLRTDELLQGGGALWNFPTEVHAGLPRSASVSKVVQLRGVYLSDVSDQCRL